MSNGGFYEQIGKIKFITLLLVNINLLTLLSTVPGTKISILPRVPVTRLVTYPEPLAFEKQNTTITTHTHQRK